MTAPVVLAVIPGAGSTKLALFQGGEPLGEEKRSHEEPSSRPAARTWDELPVRVARIRAFLCAQGVPKGALRVVAGRGGLLRPLSAGAYSGAEEPRLRRRLFGDGGLYATSAPATCPGRAEGGDAQAALVLDALASQVAKGAGWLAAALLGQVDAVLLTGGLVHMRKVVEAVTGRIGWIARVSLHPGEDEGRALAEGVLRVLSGEEPLRTYPG